MYRIAITSGILFGIVVTIILLGITIFQHNDETKTLWAMGDKQSFYFVTLSNSQVFVGKVATMDKAKLKLDFVYYLQSKIDPETQVVSQKLVNRNNELHQPEYTEINMAHVLMIEPVKKDSKIAQLLAKAKTI